jgi:hypothetical protein
MRNFTLFSFFVFLISGGLLYSQSPSRFPVKPGSVWRINYEFSFSQEHTPGDEVYKYFVNGDSLIGNHSYFKLYKSGILYLETPLQIKNKYIGALRDSASKYYFIPAKAEEEILLYDFDRKVGETIDDGHFGGYTIDNIDTLSDGRRRFQFGIITVHCGSANTVVEGIGWLGGLLEGNSCYAHPGIRGSYAVCYTDSGGGYFLSELAIANGIMECTDIPSGAGELVKNDFYWKKEGNMLLLEVPLSDRLKHVDLYDICGRKIYQLEPESTQTFRYNTSSLKPGIYILRGQGQNRSYTIKIHQSGPSDK